MSVLSLVADASPRGPMPLQPAPPAPAPVPLPPGSAPPIPLAADRTFDGLLRAAGSRDREAEAREAAEKFVSIAFVEPVLASLRDGTLGEGPFAPSDAERRFSPMLHQHLADRIVAGASFPLVERIASHLMTLGKNATPAPDAVLPLPEMIDVHG